MADVYKHHFTRYARLLLSLPPKSRWMMKQIPSKDWDLDKETQSRILMMLDVISCQLSNMHRKKGSKTRKPQEQFQPDYVVKAKKIYEQERKKRHEYSEEEMQTIKDFWAKRNPEAKRLED